MTSPTPAIALHPHPQTPADAVAALEARYEWAQGGGLVLRYRLQGDISRLRIPQPQTPGPADGLWAHACFEAFIAAAGCAAYHEFNFSPSGQWAGYMFRGYRERDISAEPLPAPRLSWRQSASLLELEAGLPAGALPLGGRLQLGLSAVIEAADGQLSYWALRHPAERPDFHHRLAFALELART